MTEKQGVGKNGEEAGKMPFPETEERKENDPKIILYERQKELLDTFLSTGAITRAQYEKSLGCLTEKMKLGTLYPENTPEGLKKERVRR